MDLQRTINNKILKYRISFIFHIFHIVVYILIPAYRAHRRLHERDKLYIIFCIKYQNHNRAVRLNISNQPRPRSRSILTSTELACGTGAIKIFKMTRRLTTNVKKKKKR